MRNFIILSLTSLLSISVYADKNIKIPDNNNLKKCDQFHYFNIAKKRCVCLKGYKSVAGGRCERIEIPNCGPKKHYDVKKHSCVCKSPNQAKDKGKNICH